MEFDSSQPLKPQLQKFTQRSDENGKFMSSVYFYGKNYDWVKPKKDDRKKINWEELKILCSQSTSQGHTEALETVYLSALKLMRDPSIKPEEKFDLMFGDVEILLEASITDFKTKYDRHATTMGDTTIAGIRERYKEEESYATIN